MFNTRNLQDLAFKNMWEISKYKVGICYLNWKRNILNEGKEVLDLKWV